MSGPKKIRIQLYQPPKPDRRSIRRLPKDPKYETTDDTDTRPWQAKFMTGKNK